MPLFRIFLIAFNVVLITFLVYRLMQIFRSNSTAKRWILPIGIFLLLLPSLMLVGILRSSAAYILVYPVAIGLFIYLIKDDVTR